MSIALQIDLMTEKNMYKCPYCRRLFETALNQRCPHCARVVLTPGFFRARPRPAGATDAPPEPGAIRRSRVRPPAVFSLIGHSGFKVAVILTLLMLAGFALVTKSKAPPSNTNVRKIDRARLSLANLRVALDIFRDDTGAYPAASEGLAALVHPPSTENGWKGPYIYELKNDLWGIPFQYEPGPTNLVLFGCGPDRTAHTADDILITQADIDLRQAEGSVYAVIVFRDGTRKIIREQVNTERVIPADMAPPAMPR
jgi:type II secretion system protein G